MRLPCESDAFGREFGVERGRSRQAWRDENERRVRRAGVASAVIADLHRVRKKIAIPADVTCDVIDCGGLSISIGLGLDVRSDIATGVRLIGHIAATDPSRADSVRAKACVVSGLGGNGPAQIYVVAFANSF